MAEDTKTNNKLFSVPEQESGYKSNGLFNFSLDSDNIEPTFVDLEEEPEDTLVTLDAMIAGQDPVDPEVLRNLSAEEVKPNRDEARLQAAQAGTKERELKYAEERLLDPNEDPQAVIDEYAIMSTEQPASKKEAAINALVKDPVINQNIQVDTQPNVTLDLLDQVRGALEENDAIGWNWDSAKSLAKLVFIPADLALETRPKILTWEHYPTGDTFFDSEEQAINVVLSTIHDAPREERSELLLSFINHIMDPEVGMDPMHREIIMMGMLDPDRYHDEATQSGWNFLGRAFIAAESLPLVGSLVKSAKTARAAYLGRMALRRAETSTPLQVMATADPAKATEVVAKIKAGDKDLQKAMGVSDEDLVGLSVPKPFADAADTRIVDATEEAIRETDALLAQIEGPRDVSDTLVTPLARVEAVTKAQANYDALYKSKPNAANATLQKIDDQTIEVTMPYGTHGGTGFANKRQAEWWAKRNGLLDDAAITVDKDGHWWVNVKQRIVADPLADDVDLGLDAIKARGPVSKILTSAAHYMSDQVRQLGNVQRGASQRTAVDLLAIVEKDVLKADVSTKAGIQYLLKMGEKYGKDFTPHELASMASYNGKAVTAQEARGYIAARKYFDKIHEIEDAAMIKNLKQQGYTHTFKYKNNIMGVKPISVDEALASAPNKSVVNMIDGKRHKYSKADLQDLLNRGYRVVEPKGGFASGVKDRPAKFVLIPPSQKHAVRLLGDSGALRKQGGYIPRFYKGTYFVRLERPRKDGTMDTVALGNFRTRKEAEEFQAAQQADMGSAGDRLIIDQDYAATVKSGANPYDTSVHELDNMMFYQERAKTFTAGEGTIVDPLEALSRSLGMVAHNIGSQGVIDTLEKGFLRTFGKEGLNILRTGDRMPKSAEGIVVAKAGVDPKDIERAKSMLDYIEAVKGNISHGIVDQKAREMLLHLGDYLVESGIVGGKTIGLSLMEQARTGRSMGGHLKNLAFTVQIALNPARQFVIQAQQRLFLTGLDPSVQATTLVSGYNIGTAAATRRLFKSHRYKDGQPTGLMQREAQALKRLSKEEKIILERFEKSGLNELSTNIQLDEVAAFGAARNLWNRPIDAMRKMGFESGEVVNLGSTFTFATKLYAKNTGKKVKNFTQDDWDKVIHNTREYTFNMTDLDSFKYQHGLLSVMSQYVAVRHKALQAVLPQALGGSQVFTGKQKAALFGANLVTYGAEGAGVGLIAHQMMQAFDIDFEDITIGDDIVITKVDQHNALYGGLVDYTVNSMADAAMGQIYGDEYEARDSSMSVSASTSALANIDDIFVGLHDVAFSLVRSNLVHNKPVTEWILGPSAGPTSDYFKFLAHTGRMLQDPVLDTPDKIVNSIDAALKVIPSYRNFQRLDSFDDLPRTEQRILSGTMKYLNRKNVYISDVTGAEVIGSALVGFQPRSVDEYYKLNKSATKMKADLGVVVDDLVQAYYTDLRDVGVEAAEHNFSVRDFFIRQDYEGDPDLAAMHEEMLKSRMEQYSAELARDTQLQDRLGLTGGHKMRTKILDTTKAKGDEWQYQLLKEATDNDRRFQDRSEQLEEERQTEGNK